VSLLTRMDYIGKRGL